VIDQVGAHVAERALAPVHPAAPIARMVNRVVLDLWGDPKEQILRVAKECRADLIIMGARILSNPAAVWGSTIAGVLRDGRYPVLAVRHLGE